MIIFRNITAFAFAFQLWSIACGQQPLQMRMEDRVRIAEAMNISEQYGEVVWQGLRSVPFTLILVTDSTEFLIHHFSPTDDFTFLYYDSVLSSEIYYRKTTFSRNLLATFPAVKGVSTIVVGTPENTGKQTTDWIITLLHEHFHQFTYSSPGYYQAVDSLGLSGGDKTGMWTLNYPFPYSNSGVSFKYRNYVSALSKCLTHAGTDLFASSFTEYLGERNSFKQVLSPADYRYFSFQVWQEGLARYAEYKFLELLGNYRPAKEVSDLPDFISFDEFRKQFYKRQLSQITECSLETAQRACFYAVGFAEGLILDRLNPSWREHYLTRRFYVEKYSEQFEIH